MGVALWLAGWQGSWLNEPGPARERGYLGSTTGSTLALAPVPSVFVLHDPPLKSQAFNNDKNPMNQRTTSSSRSSGAGTQR